MNEMMMVMMMMMMMKQISQQQNFVLGSAFGVYTKLGNFCGLWIL